MDLYAAVRLETGDSETEGGILPGENHFTDAEIDYAAESEGITVPNLAPTAREVAITAARVLEIASVHWASQPEEIELGPSANKQTQSKLLQQRASELRSKWGSGSGAGKVVSAPSYVGLGMSYATENTHG